MILKLFLLFTLCGCVIEAAVVKNPKTKSQWELMEAITAASKIRGFNGTWITEEEFYYTATNKSILKFNARTKSDTEFFSSEILELYGASTFTLSPDNKKLLVRYDVEEVFRHSRIAKYDVIDIETKSVTSIQNGQKLQYCRWSPTTDKISYVFNNNVYVFVEEGLEIRITDEGIDGVIYNGIPDWVYEEEVLSSGSAMWWSKDSRKLAIGMFNDTNVETFKYHIYGDPENPEDQYPTEIDLKYPKPGTPNPAVALRIFDITKDPPMVSIVKAPESIVSKDHILQNVAWADEQNVLVTWLNRRQNVASIQLCSVSAVCREVVRIDEPNGWITMGNPICLNSGKNCIFSYWIDEWYQVWNLDLNTGQNIWQSRGNFTVLQVYGYDELNNKLYYRATAVGDPSVYHVYGNDECLSCDMVDVDGELCQSASASFSKNFSYYAITCTGPNPAYTKIMESKANVEVRVWEPNTDFRQSLKLKLRPIIQYMNVTLADGSIGFARMQLPPNFDEKKKYPMVVNVYGGPNSVRVTRAFMLGFDAYMTTNREVIYTTIDGRGTGNKGKKLLFSVNNNLGEHEVEDQIYVTRYLQKTFSYIDADRCGIWGWSYGGYMTAKVLANDTDRVFQCGVSVAPVTSWIYYDTIYTERYMGLPTPEDNLEKYHESSVLERIENFKNHDFLLIHGSGDDNVHYQQSLMLAKVLQHNDILFEEMTYTDENHGIGNFLPHLYNTIDNFWINCLNLDIEEMEK